MDDIVFPYDDDPVAVYLHEIGQIAPLDTDEETNCIQHIRAGDQEAASAAKRLMEAHLHLVVSIAERYCHKHGDMLDLLQRGNLGLMNAVQNLGSSHFDSFLNYATSAIERAIEETPGDSGLSVV